MTMNLFDIVYALLEENSQCMSLGSFSEDLSHIGLFLIFFTACFSESNWIKGACIYILLTMGFCSVMVSDID